MSIYAKKNSRGEPTGLWVIEVTVGGKRYKETTRDHAEAVERDKALKGMGTAGNATPPSARPAAPPVYTVGKLQKEALALWRGNKDEDNSVRRFEVVCDILGADTPLATVRTAQLDSVVDTLRARGLADPTIHRHLASFSGAMRWAVTRDKLVGMPTIPWPKPGKPNDTIISHGDEARVLKWLRANELKDVALVMDVLLATGARIGEVLDLEPDDVYTDEVTFRDTKNGDDRKVPIDEPLARLLHSMTQIGFPSYRRINTALHRARAALKVDHKVTPHVMRHTVGTRLNDAGVTLPTIGKLMGHRNERTTMGYIHPEREAVRAAASHLKRPDIGDKS